MGPDCGGKSTISNAVADRLGVPVRPHRKVENDVAALQLIVDDIAFLGENPKYSFVRDQWPFPVDNVYMRALSSDESPFEKVYESLSQVYRREGVIFVYVTASPECLEERYNKRGDELWNLAQIKRVAHVWEEFYAQEMLHHNIVKVDTSKKAIDVAVDEALRYINELHEQIQYQMDIGKWKGDGIQNRTEVVR